MSEISLKIVFFGVYSFNTESHELKRLGERIPLRPKAARLLARLIDEDGEVVSHEDLYAHIWGRQVVEKQIGLHRLIRDIRYALDDNDKPSRYLINVPGIGYKIIMADELVVAPQQSRAVDRKAAFLTGFLSFPVLFIAYCVMVAQSA